MSIHLVTGHAGENHVTSQDQASLQAGVYSGRLVALDRGEKLRIEELSANTYRIHSGDLLFWGRHVRIPAGQYIDLTVDNGTPGLNRIDAIVLRYERDPSTGVESCSLAVKKGTPSTKGFGDNPLLSGGPTPPGVDSVDILDGSATLSEGLLYRISLRGTELYGITRHFEQVPAMAAHLQDTSNPHHVTPEQIGALSASHTHIVRGTYVGSGRSNPKLPLIQSKTPVEIHIMADLKSNSYAEAHFLIDPRTPSESNGHVSWEGGRAYLHCGVVNAGTEFGWYNSGISAAGRMDQSGTTYIYTIHYMEAV